MYKWYCFFVYFYMNRSFQFPFLIPTAGLKLGKMLNKINNLKRQCFFQPETDLYSVSGCAG